MLLEIGTYNSVHARQMVETAAIHWPIHEVEYFGFDLFEALTEDELRREFSKRPPPYLVVREKLRETGAQIRLFKGNTKETLPQFVESVDRNKRFDLVFVDGGHAIDTIASDWHYVQQIIDSRTIVVFDDYYNNDEDEVEGVGCNRLIDGLDRSSYEVRALEPEDSFTKDWGVLKVRMVSVRQKN
jgi:hypothetical protein